VAKPSLPLIIEEDVGAVDEVKRAIKTSSISSVIRQIPSLSAHLVFFN